MPKEKKRKSKADTPHQLNIGKTVKKERCTVCTRCGQTVLVVQGKGHPYLANHVVNDFWCGGSGALVEET
jgi:hypothetical protein